MRQIRPWPVVRRDDIVRAFVPGTAADRESPFRALRVKGWASTGVAVPRRRSGRLAGQTVVYSALDVEAARWARAGSDDGARRFAEAAGRVEASRGFALLRDLLRSLDEPELQGVLDGRLPSGPAQGAVESCLTALATETAAAAAGLPTVHDGFAGEVSRRGADSVVVRAPDGTQTAVPLWLAAAAHRDQVGDRLVLVSERLDGRQALVRVLPGIEIPAQRRTPQEPDAFSPFGRADPRVARVTAEDLGRLAGDPAPLQVLVPVRIEE